MPNQNSRGQHQFKTRKNNINRQSPMPQGVNPNNQLQPGNNFNNYPQPAPTNYQGAIPESTAPDNFAPANNTANQPVINPNAGQMPQTPANQTSYPPITQPQQPNNSKFNTHQDQVPFSQPTVTMPVIKPHQYNAADGQNAKPPYPSNKQPQYQPTVNPNLQSPQQAKKTAVRFWKRPVVWIVIAIIVLAAVGIILFLLLQPPTKKDTSNSSRPVKTEKVTDSPDKALHAKKHPAKDVAKKQNSLQADKKALQPKARDWNNSGSYDDMKYDTDDFTIQLNNSSNGVKLIPDANNKPALFIEYTFTNKSKQPQKPADIVHQDIQLKQNDQALETTTPASDNHDAQDKLNAGQKEVAPGQKIDTAMIYTTKDTKNTISMYFMDLKTHQLLNTNQPFKL